MKYSANPRVSNSSKRIVINTSPWIALSLCGQTSLLSMLYDEAYMPTAVKDEIVTGGRKMIGVKELDASSWIKIEKVKDAEKIELLYELEQGEAEVIVLAKEKGIQYVMIDERVARWQARILGLEVIGTLGILLKAKKLGLMSLL